MIFETLTTIAFGGVAAYSYFKGEGPAVNDSDKILRILNNSGLNVKEKNGGKAVTKTIRILRKRKIEGGMEYVFHLPYGLASEKVINHKNVLEDGLNTKGNALQFERKDLLKIKWDKTAFHHIKKILTTKKTVKKELDFEFDGTLKIKVYDGEMSGKIIWNGDMLKPGTWSAVVGLTRNEIIYHDFDKRKHLIVAGSTGGGKSFVIKLIVTSLLLSKPDDVVFSLIDLKGGPAFARFKDCKQVENFGVDTNQAYEILKKLQKKMNEDYKKIVEGGFEDVEEAGIKKRHFIVVDEAADLVDNSKAMEILTDIVRKGRGVGFYIIYSTQYPSVQAIPMQIKRNIPARLCFVLDSSSASMTVLDAPGAEDLPEIPGRCIYKEIKQITMQAPLMSNKKIDELIEPFKIEKKDDDHGEKPQKPREDTKHTFEFIETRLS
ncbi:FtsK/SpoIIIE domain-containing protein [Peribacillus butanolivorans]|uniref:FtsK/SpoIIIE domain-containing protein n=1 Tax=Peribacillus butanolivorans TaxID=421767 RepID=UPI003816C78C